MIFLTAKAEPCEQRRLDEAGARGLITKPFDPLSLAHDVETILGTSQH